MPDGTFRHAMAGNALWPAALTDKCHNLNIWLLMSLFLLQRQSADAI